MDWDLTSYFKAFDGPDYQAFKAALTEDLQRLSHDMSELGDLSHENSSPWTQFTEALEDLTSRFGHLISYLECLCAADATEEGYARDYAWLKEQSAGLHTLSARFNSRLGQSSDEAFAQFIAQEELQDAAFYLSECRTRAQFQMDNAAEDLASELSGMLLVFQYFKFLSLI